MEVTWTMLSKIYFINFCSELFFIFFISEEDGLYK